MSGGYFDYKQYEIDRIADQVEQLIIMNDENEYYRYPSRVVDEFRKGQDLLRRAAVYAQRIDWLVSGDDGAERFLERLAEDLEELERVNDEPR